MQKKVKIIKKKVVDTDKLKKSVSTTFFDCLCFYCKKNKAKFIFKNGNYCCELTWQQCKSKNISTKRIIDEKMDSLVEKIQSDNKDFDVAKGIIIRKRKGKRRKRIQKGQYISPIAGTVELDSGWEFRYAIYLDSLGVKWERNTKKFPYFFKGKSRNYIPDFYVHDWNEYIEIKGRKKAMDEAKWRDFPHKLKILQLKELKILKLL